jgi:hypothetical protein
VNGDVQGGRCGEEKKRGEEEWRGREEVERRGGEDGETRGEREDGRKIKGNEEAPKNPGGFVCGPSIAHLGVLGHRQIFTRKHTI